MAVLKRFSFILMAAMCLVVLQACGTEIGEEVETTSEIATAQNGLKYEPNVDPEPMEGYDEGFNGFLGIYTEEKYDQIVVESVKEVYSLSEDTVFKCTVANNNPGHGFYVYGATYIDKLIDGEWVRQCSKYAVDEAFHLQWMYVGVEGNTEGINSSMCMIAVSDVFPEPTPGRYRLVVFTPVNTHYAEFDVQE